MLQTFIVPLTRTQAIEGDAFLRAIRRNGIRPLVPDYDTERQVTVRVTLPTTKTMVVNQSVMWESIRKHLVANEIISASDPCTYEFRFAYSVAVLDHFYGELVIEVEEIT